MTAREDAERAAAIALDPIAQAIFDAIEALPHARRLYPDLYAIEVADAVRAATTTDWPRVAAEYLAVSRGEGTWEMIDHDFVFVPAKP